MMCDMNPESFLSNFRGSCQPLQRSQAHHKPNIQWFSLHLYGTNPIVYSFARSCFEVVIRERLSKLFQMSCIRLLEYIAKIGFTL